MSTTATGFVGDESLGGLVVSVQGVLTFCNNTNTVPPPPLQGRLGRFWTILKSGRQLAPPPCLDAEARAATYEAAKDAERLLESLQGMLTGLEGQQTGSFAWMYRHQNRGGINLAHWTARWNDVQCRAEIAVMRLGREDLRVALRTLIADFGVFVQEEAARQLSPPAEMAASSIELAEPIDKGRAPRLRMKRGSAQVLFDGEKRLVPEQPLKLLRLLADSAIRSDNYVLIREIEEHVWGKTISRLSRPVRDLVRELRDALSGEGDDREKVLTVVGTKRNVGTRRSLAAEDIAIEE